MSRTIVFAALLLPTVALADGAPMGLTPDVAPTATETQPTVSEDTEKAGQKGFDPLPPGLVPDHIEPYGAPSPGEILAPKHEHRRGMPAS